LRLDDSNFFFFKFLIDILLCFCFFFWRILSDCTILVLEVVYVLIRHVVLSPRTAWLSHGWREILNRTAALSRISLFPFRNYPWNHHFRTPPLILFQNCAPSRKMSYNCLLPGENTVTSSPFLIIPLEQNLLRRGLFVQPFSGVKKNYIACGRSSVLGDGTR